MKKIRYLLTALLFSASMNAAAAPVKEECNGLAGMSSNLNTVAKAFKLIGEIKQGDELDKALGEVVDAMVLVAEAENTPRLTNAVGDLSQAYNSLNANQFQSALNQVIHYMHGLYQRECL